MKTYKQRVCHNSKFIGEIVLPKINSYKDIRLAQAFLALTKEDFLHIMQQGIRLAKMNEVRYLWYKNQKK